MGGLTVFTRSAVPFESRQTGAVERTNRIRTQTVGMAIVHVLRALVNWRNGNI